jgi:hypothetical protein
MADGARTDDGERGGCFLPILAGAAVYLLVVSIGLGVTINVIRSTPLERPNAIEVYEMFPDFIDAMFSFFFGLGISPIVAFFMALTTALYVAWDRKGSRKKC